MSNPIVQEMRQMIAAARVGFFRDALPLCRSEAEFQFARNLAAAVGEVSPDEALAALKTVIACEHQWRDGRCSACGWQPDPQTGVDGRR